MLTDEYIFKMTYWYHEDADFSMIDGMELDIITVQEFLDSHKYLTVDETQEFFSAMRFNEHYTISELIVKDYENCIRVTRYLNPKVGKHTWVKHDPEY
jgi:hypothetical protein